MKMKKNGMTVSKIVFLLLALSAAPVYTANDMDIFEAAAKGNLKAVTDFVKNKHVSVDKRSFSEKTPLHIASEYGKIDVVQYLVENKSDVNAKDFHGRTPLHLAAEENAKVVKYLTEGEFAGKIVDVVKYLVENKSDINAKDFHGRTPLHLAAEKSVVIVKYLIEKGADVNAKDKKLNTPLHYAADEGKLEIVKYLVETGADVNATNNDGKTPADLTNNKEIKEYLTNGMK